MEFEVFIGKADLIAGLKNIFLVRRKEKQKPKPQVGRVVILLALGVFIFGLENNWNGFGLYAVFILAFYGIRWLLMRNKSPQSLLATSTGELNPFFEKLISKKVGKILDERDSIDSLGQIKMRLNPEGLQVFQANKTLLLTPLLCVFSETLDYFFVYSMVLKRESFQMAVIPKQQVSDVPKLSSELQSVFHS